MSKRKRGSSLSSSLSTSLSNKDLSDNGKSSVRSSKIATQKSDIVNSDSDSDESMNQSDSMSEEGDDNNDNDNLDEEEEEEESTDKVDFEKTASTESQKKQDNNLSLKDVQMAREASELFKSGLFKLKIDEVLKTIKVSEEVEKKMQKILFKINSMIKLIPDSDSLTLNEAKEKIENSPFKIAIPFTHPKPSKDVKFTFRYQSPASINVVGGFSLKTHVRSPNVNTIDLVTVLPKELFSPKDYLNYRYFHKRAFYIAYMVKELQLQTQKEDLPFIFGYEYFNDDVLKPVIRITSKNGKSEYHFGHSKFEIRILTSIQDGTFNYKKLSSDMNAVRAQLSDSSNQVKLPPTPLYNHSILTDAVHLRYNEFLHRASIECPEFNAACKLGRLWLHQRAISSPSVTGGFGHFEWAMLTAVLLYGNGADTHTLLKGYSSYQLFKGVIQFISSVNLLENDLVFSARKGETFAVKINKSTSPCFMDKDYNINIFSNLSKTNYGILVHEASITSDILSDNCKDHFDDVFLKKVYVPELRFDCYFRYVKFIILSFFFLTSKLTNH